MTCYHISCPHRKEFDQVVPVTAFLSIFRSQIPLVLAIIEAGVQARRLGRDLRGRPVHLDQLGRADHLDLSVQLHRAREK